MKYGEDNIMVILSSPSGAGKTTLTKKFNKNTNPLKFQYHTQQDPQDPTRLMVLIIFLFKKNDFSKLIKQEKFYEYAEIFGNFYGTSKKKVVNETIKKNDLIFDIDWQGTKQLSKFEDLKLIKIYLITDNKDELKKRLISRNQNLPMKLKKAKSFESDIKHWNDYDYIIINKNLEICFKQIEKIILNNKRNYTNYSQIIQ